MKTIKIIYIVAFISVLVISSFNSVSSLSIHKPNEKTKLKTLGRDILNLKKGDIVTRNVDADRFPMFQNFKHPLMYTGKTNILSDGREEYCFIEANGGKGVCYSNYTLEGIRKVIHKKIYRVINATEKQIDNAVAFAESQLGKPFQTIVQQMRKEYNPEVNDSWYCTELIWAAYFNCDHHPNEKIYGFGIDIDADKGLNVWPWDIWESPETIELDLFYHDDMEQQKSSNQLSLDYLLFKFLKETGFIPK